MIEINIKPVPAPRPRVTRWGTYNDPKYTAFKKALATVVKTHIKQPLSGAIGIEVIFVFEVPKSWNKAKKESAKNHTSKPDIDNLQKSIMDSLNGVAYKDDGQVCYMVAKKFYGDCNKIFLSIKEI